MAQIDFRRAGQLCKALEWTDAELKLTLDGLKETIKFLEGRGDCGLIVKMLRIELTALSSMDLARKG